MDARDAPGPRSGRSTTSRRPAAARPRAWVAVVAFVGALSAAGVATSLVSMTGGTPVEERRAVGGRYGVTAVVPTTFGTVAVQRVNRLRGLTHQQLSGVTHFPSYVGPDKVQLQLGVELTNLDDRRSTPFSPKLFRLRVGSGRLLTPRAANFRAGRLQPSASLRGDVIFIVPRGTAPMTVEIVEPGVRGARPVIDLGRRAASFEGTIDAIGHDHIERVRNR